MQQPYVENTIDFNKALKLQPKKIELIPKSKNQEQLILNLTNKSHHIVVAVGPAGTGKTYLSMLAAVKAFRSGECDKLILTRPAVGVDDEKHGFLPGGLNEKMEPWTRPLLDVIGEYYSPKEILRLIEDKEIEISPLAFMRGRTFKNAWIIADEMQGSSVNQMKMLLTRIGEGSKIVITGDLEQTDKKMQNDNGLQDYLARLSTYRGDNMSYVEFTAQDVRRHPIIKDVLELYSK
jgi:phosphate starvation-inducible protein PhoH and related proteins